MLLGAIHFPALWTGASFLLVWGMIGVTALAAIYTQGRRRAPWLGATLFGAGYLVLIFGPDEYSAKWSHLAVDNYIRALCPAILPREQVNPPSSPEIAAANMRIRQMLEKSVAMEFPQETPLAEVLKYIRAATQGPDDTGLPIYVDPIGLQEAEKTLQSPVVLELSGVPLKRSLYILLKQLGLVYDINEGLIVINSESTDDRPLFEDPILPVAHCVLALLAAGMGALLATIVARRFD
jgi:hypothetical protein